MESYSSQIWSEQQRQQCCFSIKVRMGAMEFMGMGLTRLESDELWLENIRYSQKYKQVKQQSSLSIVSFSTYFPSTYGTEQQWNSVCCGVDRQS